MAENKNIKALGDLNLADRELRHLAAAWLAHRDGENFDINIFTTLTGHPNPANARKRFGEIKKKVRALAGLANGPTPANTKTKESKYKAAVSKRKANNPIDSMTPAKRVRGWKGQIAVAEDKNAVDEVQGKEEPAGDEQGDSSGNSEDGDI